MSLSLLTSIFKNVEFQLSAGISLVVYSESLVRVPRTNDSDMHDTRTILGPILRYTYDSGGFIRVTYQSLVRVSPPLCNKALPTANELRPC